MSMQPLMMNEDTTSMEAAKTDSQSRSKWGLLVTVACLILIEVGGTLLLCYRCENPAPVPTLQGR
jgi:hypothetical protein